jgi:integrase
MSMRLTDKAVKELPKPESGNRTTYDAEVKGFGIRITAAGARSFVLNYRTTAGRERRYTIGAFPDWRTSAAREEARRLKQRIRSGHDPLAELEAERTAPTVADMCRRYREEHLPKLRPSTQRDYERALGRIEKALGRAKVADVTFDAIDRLHRAISKQSANEANRLTAVASRMFNLAVRRGWRADNPARGVERNDEVKRERYLSSDELARLTVALADHRDQQAANILRLLLLTGARRGEVQAARWDQFDLTAGIWTKPSSHTKQKKIHRVPLSDAAALLLRDLRGQAAPGAEFVFPGRAGGHRVEIKGNWAAICKAASISGARVHDLRHSYASVLASAGLSLPVIGALLGHTQPQTTARYAHLLDDPLRAATERASAIITGKPSAEVVPIRKEAR